MFYAPALRTTRSARAFDSAFERFLTGAFTNTGLAVQQDDSAWTVTLDLPGIAREHLDIEIEGAVVRITTAQDSKRQFKAAYELPEEIDQEATEAELKDGVLTLKLAKKKPVSNARKLTLK